jgi:methylenetetrahydrofolate dehydrogenase (NADP+) / methenyltetrahydrofolate cyclohydrolase
MAARILDGAAIARTIRAELASRIQAVTARLGRPPGLGVVLVGDDPASEIYVRNKLKAAHESGVRADLRRLPATATLTEVLRIVEALNESDEHDGILVQSPLPRGLGRGAEQAVFDRIDPAKDVDGFHPANVGRLVQNRALLTPGTPTGVIELLDRSGIQIAGSRAVVIGRSEIVGKPTALLLLHRDATVTICHSKTPDLAAVTGQADILVAAIGRPWFVGPEFVKPGSTIIDVGVTRVTDPAYAKALFAGMPDRLRGFEMRGSAVMGDVHPRCGEVAGAMTPVPGGVGPLTIAMLLANTVKAAMAAIERQSVRW